MCLIYYILFSLTVTTFYSLLCKYTVCSPRHTKYLVIQFILKTNYTFFLLLFFIYKSSFHYLIYQSHQTSTIFFVLLLSFNNERREVLLLLCIHLVHFFRVFFFGSSALGWYHSALWLSKYTTPLNFEVDSMNVNAFSISSSQITAN